MEIIQRFAAYHNLLYTTLYLHVPNLPSSPVVLKDELVSIPDYLRMLDSSCVASRDRQTDSTIVKAIVSIPPFLVYSHNRGDGRVLCIYVTCTSTSLQFASSRLVRKNGHLAFEPQNRAVNVGDF